MARAFDGVVVLGATGTQGGPVARRLLSRGERVRALVRDERRGASLREAGADLAVADLDRAETLAQAFAGADAAFVQLSASQPWRAMLAQARNVLAALRAARVARVVVTTTSVVPPARTGRATPDSRIALVEAVRELVPHATLLAPTLYLENFSGPLRGALESGVIPQAIPEDVPVRYLSLDDHAGYAVAALETRGLEGRFVPIGGRDALDGRALAATLGAALRRPLQYAALPPAAAVEQLAAFLPRLIAEQIGEMYAYEGGEGAALLSPDPAHAAALPFEPTSAADWAARAFA